MTHSMLPVMLFAGLIVSLASVYLLSRRRELRARAWRLLRLLLRR
jgi:hypothetical protein